MYQSINMRFNGNCYSAGREIDLVTNVITT